jgi:hypothetical protein
MYHCDEMSLSDKELELRRPSPTLTESYIAIQPSTARTSHPEESSTAHAQFSRDTPSTLGAAPGDTSCAPPSFQSSQFDIVLRRQRTRPREGGGIKATGVPSRFLNLSNAFEFAGWGTIFHVVLGQDDMDAGERTIRAASDAKTLGQFTASALAGNAILGSVFYALPAVVIVSGIL